MKLILYSILQKCKFKQQKWAIYPDNLEFDEEDGRFYTRLYFHRQFPIFKHQYSQLIHYARVLFVRNMKTVQRIYSSLKVFVAGIFFTETSDYFRKFYGRHTGRPCAQI